MSGENGVAPSVGETEVEQISNEEGGSGAGSFDAALAEFQKQNEIAQVRNLKMMGVQVEEGTALKAAGLQVNPK